MDGRTESCPSEKYAPDILGEIKDVLDDIEERGDLLPKSELKEAVTYLRNEWNAVVDIFNYGDLSVKPKARRPSMSPPSLRPP